MSAACAMQQCEISVFRASLCQRHYSEVLVAADEHDGPTHRPGRRPGPRQLESALYLFNRLADNIIERYRSAFALGDADVMNMHLDEAANHIRGGAAEAASSCLERAEAFSPQNSQLKRQLADLNLSQGRYEEALSGYEGLQDTDPDQPGLRGKVGQALSSLGRHDEAVTHLEDAARADPDNAEAQYHLGATAEALGQYEGAVSAFGQAISRDPNNPRYHQALGFSHEALGNHQDGLRCFKRALELER